MQIYDADKILYTIDKNREVTTEYEIVASLFFFLLLHFVTTTIFVFYT